MRSKSILLSFILFIMISINVYSEYHYFEVTSYNGVNVRASPSSKGQIISKIPYKSSVRIVGYESQETINGEWSYWVKILFNDTQTGYVFSENLGHCNKETDFLNAVYLDQTKKDKDDDSYIFVSDTLEFITSNKGLYLAKYRAIYPNSDNGNHPAWEYVIYKEKNGDFKNIMSHRKQLWLIDIDEDGNIDLIGKFGGCCGNQSSVTIYLSEKEKLFDIHSKGIETDIAKSDDFIWEKYSPEQFYYSTDYNKYIVAGKETKDKDQVIEYFYYFDKVSKQLIKIR